MKEVRYILLPYQGPSSRISCPDCKKPREFTRYLDLQTGALLPDHVGRCNREEQCGYHYTPRQYFENNSWHQMDYAPVQPSRALGKKVQYLPIECIERTLRCYDNNSFYRFIAQTFTEDVANTVCDKYLIGTSIHWKGANVFWQVDCEGNVRQCKIMLYDSYTGKRVKSEQKALKYDWKSKGYTLDTDNGDKVYFAGKRILKDYSANLIQCFFGEHLIVESKVKRIAIVESEKTAVIASIFYPDYIWLATGGNNGCRWSDATVFKSLTNREVVLFPDLNQYQNWQTKASEVQKRVVCKILVSDVLEKNATDEQKSQGLDLADFLLESMMLRAIARVGEGASA